MLARHKGGPITDEVRAAAYAAANEASEEYLENWGKSLYMKVRLRLRLEGVVSRLRYNHTGQESLNALKSSAVLRLSIRFRVVGRARARAGVRVRLAVTVRIRVKKES